MNEDSQRWFMIGDIKAASLYFDFFTLFVISLQYVHTKELKEAKQIDAKRGEHAANGMVLIFFLDIRLPLNVLLCR